jgi:hypothetical protein
MTDGSAMPLADGKGLVKNLSRGAGPAVADRDSA